jgi:hypothetical protein
VSLAYLVKAHAQACKSSPRAFTLNFFYGADDISFVLIFLKKKDKLNNVSFAEADDTLSDIT